MYYKTFHDIKLSALGMGCLRLPMETKESERIDRIEGQKVIDLAIEKGINLFDTAYTYQEGDSEKFLGEALEKYPRDSYYLATKFYAAASSDIRGVFEEQLRRCDTDYFDFYFLHGLDENYIKDYMDEEKDYLGYLQEQKKAGRIRHIGFSSHAAPEALKRFLDWHDDFDMALIQLNYVDWTVLEAKEQYELLTEHGIPVWVMEPLKGGRLSELNAEAVEILKRAAPERSVSSWGIRFLMGLPNVQVVLSGMSTLEQVEDNVGTFLQPDPLSEEEQAVLNQATQAFLKDLGVPCSSCRYCCSYCPEKLDIPLLIKAYNEHRISGELWRIADFEQTKGPEHCAGCGACLEHCPQKIDIPAVLKRLREKK